MSQHLSPEQISTWSAGEQIADAERHLRQCAACRLEVARFQSGLEAFGQSVREWAQLQRPPASTQVWAHPSDGIRSRPWVWALAAAVVTLALVIPMYRGSRDIRDEAPGAPDAQLLDQVHAQLSRAVPAPMEPLMKLMHEEKDESQ